VNLRDFPKTYRKEMELAIKRGWTVSRGGGGHMIFRWKGGGSQIATSSTPSDHRAYKNHVARMRQTEKEYPA
jgi:hypothetical protein